MKGSGNHSKLHLQSLGLGGSGILLLWSKPSHFLSYLLLEARYLGRFQHLFSKYLGSHRHPPRKTISLSFKFAKISSNVKIIMGIAGHPSSPVLYKTQRQVSL